MRSQWAEFGQRYLDAAKSDCAGCRPDPAEFEGCIVVVLPARNEATPRAEGNKLLNTVRALRDRKAPGTDLRFFVVDDGSTDGCAKPLAQARDATVMRNMNARGQGVCRTLGLWLNGAARGIVQMDAHMDASPFGLETLILDSEATGGFVGCLSGNMSNVRDVSRRAGCRWAIKGAGADLDVGCLRRKGAGITWNYAKPDAPRLMAVPIMRGACTAATPDVWERWGAYGESYGAYGFADHDHAVRAYFQGIPCHVNTTVWARHWYRQTRPYPMSGIWTWWGYVESFRAMFQPDTWRTVFEPSARRAADKFRDPMLEYLLRTPRLDAVQARFEARKTRTDNEVLQWMGVKAS